MGHEQPRNGHSSKDKYAEAELVFYDFIDVKQRVLGEEHPETLTGTNNQAVLHRQLGKHAEAEAFLTTVV